MGQTASRSQEGGLVLGSAGSDLGVLVGGAVGGPVLLVAGSSEAAQRGAQTAANILGGATGFACAAVGGTIGAIVGVSEDVALGTKVAANSVADGVKTIAQIGDSPQDGVQPHADGSAADGPASPRNFADANASDRTQTHAAQREPDADSGMIPHCTSSKIIIELVQADDLRAKFRSAFGHRKSFPELAAVFEELLFSRGKAGILVVICDSTWARTERARAEPNLKLGTLDNGALRDVIERFCPNICQGASAFTKFRSILNGVRAHTESDVWEEDAVRNLATDLRNLGEDINADDDSLLKKLIKQPTDGAFILSFEGRLLGAADRIMHGGSYQLAKDDGTGVGVRRQSGFALVEDMVQSQDSASPPVGGVLAASSAKDLTLMLPHHGGPKAWRATMQE